MTFSKPNCCGRLVKLTDRSDVPHIESCVSCSDTNCQKLHHACQHAECAADKLTNRSRLACPDAQACVCHGDAPSGVFRGISQIFVPSPATNRPDRLTRKWTEWPCRAAAVPVWMMTQGRACGLIRTHRLRITCFPSRSLSVVPPLLVLCSLERRSFLFKSKSNTTEER